MDPRTERQKAIDRQLLLVVLLERETWRLAELDRSVLTARRQLRQQRIADVPDYRFIEGDNGPHSPQLRQNIHALTHAGLFDCEGLTALGRTLGAARRADLAASAANREIIAIFKEAARPPDEPGTATTSWSEISAHDQGSRGGPLRTLEVRDIALESWAFDLSLSPAERDAMRRPSAEAIPKELVFE